MYNRKVNCIYTHYLSQIPFRKKIGGGKIDYRLHGLTMWNPSVNDGIRAIADAEIEQAIPIIAN